MKRQTMYIAMMLVAVLAAGMLAGCGQTASSGSASASEASSATSEQATSTASGQASSEQASSEQAASEQAASEQAASGQSKDEVLAELKNAAANTPEFKSVTVNESTTWNYVNILTDKPETTQATGVYKFDMSDGKLKESVLAEYEGEKLEYFTDGKDAVFVYDGTAYSGTDKQFGAQDYVGFETFIKHVIGDLDAIVGCAASAEKVEANGQTGYMLTLDPEKYMATDELLTFLEQTGYPVKEALFTVSFDANGNVASMEIAASFEDSTIVEALAFSDFDSTVVDPAPKATTTYKEAKEDMKQEIANLMKELDAYMASPDESVSKGAEASKGAAKTN